MVTYCHSPTDFVTQADEMPLAECQRRNFGDEKSAVECKRRNFGKPPWHKLASPLGATTDTLRTCSRVKGNRLNSIGSKFLYSDMTVVFSEVVVQIIDDMKYLSHVIRVKRSSRVIWYLHLNTQKGLSSRFGNACRRRLPTHSCTNEHYNLLLTPTPSYPVQKYAHTAINFSYRDLVA